MLHHELAIEQDFVIGTAQPVTEFDIFDSRPAILLIESAMFQKYVTPDSSTTAPEGARLRPAGLMDKAVHQVSVLREKIRGGGIIIIGPYEGREMGISCERR